MIPDEKLPVPPKATSVNIGAPIVQTPKVRESDVLQVQNPLNTDNNRGSSTQTPPKPTHNLVLTKDKEGTSSARPKRTIIKPIRYKDINSISNNVSA